MPLVYWTQYIGETLSQDSKEMCMWVIKCDHIDHILDTFDVHGWCDNTKWICCQRESYNKPSNDDDNDHAAAADDDGDYDGDDEGDEDDDDNNIEWVWEPVGVLRPP